MSTKIVYEQAGEHGFRLFAPGKYYVMNRNLQPMRGNAYMKVSWQDEAMRPEWVFVAPELRRRGLGTKLYQRAAREACRKFGVPLGSDPDRSPQAEGFWKKQLRKGRAECELVERRRCTSYRLRCPAPSSLAGRRAG